MKIAVIGAGISGLCCAFHLRKAHDVTVFEAAIYVGGHTNTIEVMEPHGTMAVDTGFIVFNDRTYPSFTRLLDELGVASQPTDMSFSVRCDRSGIEYAGTGLNGLFAQRRNLFRPGFHRLLRDWLRFSRESGEVEAEADDRWSVGDYLDCRGYSQEFIEQYFLPMGSAVWSCPHDDFRRFPMRFIVEFYRNHGLLSVSDRPQWRVIRGGSRRYVEEIVRHLPRDIVLNCPVAGVCREADGVELRFPRREPERFDHVVFACHSDQALSILGEQATRAERAVLGAFRYEANEVTVHSDSSILPRCKRAWASWNYRIPRCNSEKATVTYHMNRLQRLSSRREFCVTLNDTGGIRADAVLLQLTYHHPVFAIGRRAAQNRHDELIGPNSTSFCGAYWGNGFHEDGVRSAEAVCAKLLPPPDACDAPAPVLARKG
ncbi:MAG: FAD-dependent oxidoreductase [Planctomycetia bacterium]|nr:FAD-dependent oxidoreductase [Planctomycetia bacterium]